MPLSPCHPIPPLHRISFQCIHFTLPHPLWLHLSLLWQHGRQELFVIRVYEHTGSTSFLDHRRVHFLWRYDEWAIFELFRVLLDEVSNLGCLKSIMEYWKCENNKWLCQSTGRFILLKTWCLFDWFYLICNVLFFHFLIVTNSFKGYWWCRCHWRFAII